MGGARRKDGGALWNGFEELDASEAVEEEGLCSSMPCETAKELLRLKLSKSAAEACKTVLEPSPIANEGWGKGVMLPIGEAGEGCAEYRSSLCLFRSVVRIGFSTGVGGAGAGVGAGAGAGALEDEDAAA